MRGIKNIAYIVFLSFVCVWEKTVTAGGETWQEAIAQVLDVALIFEFSFYMHYSEPLSLSVLLHSPPFGKIRFGSACHRQT